MHLLVTNQLSSLKRNLFFLLLLPACLYNLSRCALRLAGFPSSPTSSSARHSLISTITFLPSHNHAEFFLKKSVTYINYVPLFQGFFHRHCCSHTPPPAGPTIPHRPSSSCGPLLPFPLLICSPGYIFGTHRLTTPLRAPPDICSCDRRKILHRQLRKRALSRQRNL